MAKKDAKQDIQAPLRSAETLETRVEKRTAELKAANDSLVAEIAARRRAEEELRLLISISQAVLDARDLQTAFGDVIRMVCEFTGWDYGDVWTPNADGTSLEFRASWYGSDDNLKKYDALNRNFVFPPGVGIPGRVWQTRKPEWQKDISVMSLRDFPRAQIATAARLKASLAVPIIADDKVLAVMGFVIADARTPEAHMVDLVLAVASQLGSVMRHKQTEDELAKSEARLRRSRDELEIRVTARTVQLTIANEALHAEMIERKRTQEEMQSRVRQQEAVVHIGHLALLGTPVPALLQEACNHVAELLQVEFCKVLELQPDGQSLLLRAGVGWNEGLVGQAKVEAGAHSQAGYTLSCGKPVIVEDLRNETRFDGPPLLVDHGVVSGISVVIAGVDRPFGVLGAHTSKRRRFQNEDIHFLESIAHVLSEAIERARFELVLQRSESWLRNLIATTQDAVLSIDRQGAIVLFNPSAQRMFGYTEEEVVGKKVNLLMGEPYATEHDGYIERYERTHEPRAIGRIRTVTAKRKNGELFPIELSVTEIALDEHVHYAAFIRDISDKARLQERLVDQERLATVGITAAKIGHELANPLNSISLALQALEQRVRKIATPQDSDQTAASIAKVRNEVSRLNNLLLDFRAFSRRETFRFRQAQLSELIDDVIEMEGPRLANDKVQLEKESPHDLPEIIVDSDKLKQVLLNLCKNAAEAMPEGGKITVKVMASDKEFTLEVSDTGAGIPPGTDIFAPFFTSKKEGTGLGLTIVRQIIAGHGGDISYHSQPGKGTTFRITLPREGKIAIT